ncbi:MAG: nucleotidyltransferase domain-containing protein [bacterium]|nr:nucleotidyltransferase domain-containing protein [bacterium]
MSMPADLRTALVEALSSLPGVQLAVLFGSFARGCEGPRSDVDVGLRLYPDSLADRLRAEVTLGRAARRAIDLVHLDEAPPLLRFEIAGDGQLLYEQEPGAWTEFKAQAMVDWWDFAPTARMIHAAAIRRLREEGADGQA